MSKCHVRELEQVCLSLLEDFEHAYPTLGVEFGRDRVRLLNLVKQRGIRVFLLDLPAVGKHLDKCLSASEYSPSGLPLTKRFSGGVVIPKFLRGLYLLVFHEQGRLKEDYDSQAILFLRQFFFACEKYQMECGERVVIDTVNDFVDSDQQLPEVDDFWKCTAHTEENIAVYRGFSRSQLYLERVKQCADSDVSRLVVLLMKLDKVSNFITSNLGVYDPADWRFRHGPGAIAEVTGPVNKYCWLDWDDFLEDGYPIADCGYHNYSSWAGSRDVDSGQGLKRSRSRLISVPKTFRGPRLIAAEPASKQWCQQNLWHYFRSRTGASDLRRFVSFGDQSRNQQLCLRASRDHTLATVDLRSASDRMTCHAVGQLFRANHALLRSLRASRTQVLEQHLSSERDAVLELKKFSTMGSACTFPVQTLMFLAITLASVLTTRRLSVTRENIARLEGEVAVFGDDIIVPVDSRELFCKLLEILHFEINPDKTFWTGKFRESCGVDAFDGNVITPVRVRRFTDGKPESLVSVLETRNNFYKKFYLATAEHLMSTMPPALLEVAVGSGVVGCEVRHKPRYSRKRYNANLQRDEVYGIIFRGDVSIRATNDDTSLLQFFTERPSPFDKWTHGVREWPTLRKERGWVAYEDTTAQGCILG